MPSRKSFAHHGREPGALPWRDPHTRIILAPGAVQNWPTASQLRDVARQRVIANELARQKAVEAHAARMKAATEAVEAVKAAEVKTWWGDS